MNRIIILLIVSLGLLGLLVWGLSDSVPRQGAEPLIVACAASNRPVFEALQKKYEAEFGIPIQAQFGASQTLLSSIEISQTGDLYLPADESYIEQARQKNLVSDVRPLATMRGTLAVAHGNPHRIQSLDDLFRDDVRLVQADPDAAAIGKLTREVLAASGRWEELKAHTGAFKSTVNDVANDVKIGAADAGVVYDVVVKADPDLEAVAIPEFEPIQAQIAVAVVSRSRNHDGALHLADYLASSEGSRVYREFGFQPAKAGGAPEQSAP